MAEKKQDKKERKFWNTQPVPQDGSSLPSVENFSVRCLTSRTSFISEKIVKAISVDESGPIDPVKDPEKDISPDPLPLPTGFEWSTCDVTDPATV